MYVLAQKFSYDLFALMRRNTEFVIMLDLKQRRGGGGRVGQKAATYTNPGQWWCQPFVCIPISLLSALTVHQLFTGC